MYSRIIDGIKNSEFHVVYQPQMNSDGRSMAAVEALVRWTTPAGPVPLNEFLIAADFDRSIIQIGAFVLRQACLDGLNWPGLRVAVNVSAVQLREPGFVQTVEYILRETKFPPNRLELELVESAFIDDFAKAELVILRLKSLGISVALDDFGTGYSSLTYLRKLPLDKIKIDKSFISDIDKVQSASIVQATVALARALGLKITAEGVETPEQHRFLKVCGVHYMQGFLFSKPITADQISVMLQALTAAA